MLSLLCAAYGWDFWRTLEWAKKADPSRPASAATSAQPDDPPTKDHPSLDIYTLPSQTQVVVVLLFFIALTAALGTVGYMLWLLSRPPHPAAPRN